MDNMDLLNKFLVEFGKKVKTEREARNFTLDDMEFYTTIDSSDFNKIEQGKTNITFKTFIKIAKGFRLHPKELFEFEFEFEKEE
jgi:transcriptional regulator with XRE-family HTH domain